MTDCGQKCFELQDTEHSLAVEKENNQKLEAEVKRLKGIIETPCTSCCITESLEYSLDELNDQIVNQDREIRQLKEQIEEMKCGENCKHLYHVNTGGCYDAKCDLNYLDCINCKDKWELAE